MRLFYTEFVEVFLVGLFQFYPTNTKDGKKRKSLEFIGLFLCLDKNVSQNVLRLDLIEYNATDIQLYVFSLSSGKRM